MTKSLITCGNTGLRLATAQRLVEAGHRARAWRVQLATCSTNLFAALAVSTYSSNDRNRRHDMTAEVRGSFMCRPKSHGAGRLAQ
jgi:NAD(P)-dependent dehydrogenase (short-subunit alcohol dehydrogenase family)